MTLSQQYDQQKQETADRYREMDAVDEVLHDIKNLRGSSVDEETLEDLIEQVEVERNLMLDLMIKVKPLISIYEVVVTDLLVK